MPISSPKLMVPWLHGVIARQRLFRAIESASSPVVWISGPPGAGKTTLAASYLRAARVPALWYQLDATDADPASFFFHLREAASACGLRKGAPLPRAPAESAVDFSAFAQRYFRALQSRLRARTVLVLDNFQDVDSAAFDGVVRRALEEVPAGARAIVLSRAPPPAALARLLANRQIATLAPEDLRLTQDESRQVIVKYADLPPDVVDALAERAGGWAAGVVLMAEHARRTRRAGAMPQVDSQAAVFDYFASEIFAHARPRERRTLMLVAGTPRLSSSMANAVADDKGAGQLLEHLHHRNLFVDHRPAAGPGEEPTYQFHRLFEAFLRAQAEAHLDAGQRAAAARRAGEVLEREGFVEEAAAEYARGGDFDEAARLVLAFAPRLYDQGRTRTVLDAVQRLPREIVEATPWLAYWAGASEVWFDPPSARPKLEMALRGFAARGDRIGQVLALGTITRSRILDADWRPLDAAIPALEALLQAGGDGLPPDVELYGLGRLLYTIFARDPHHARLAYWARRTHDALDRATGGNEAVMAGFSLMQFYHWTGDTDREEAVTGRVDPILADPAITPTTHAYWSWAHANFLLSTGPPEDALELLDRALGHARDHGLTIAAVITRFRVAYLITQGNLARASAELDALTEARRVEPYYEMKAWLALVQGDTHLARANATTALAMAQDRGRVFYHTFDHWLCALVDLASGRLEDARRSLAQYEEAAGPRGAPLPAYLVDLVRAWEALLSGDEAGCVVPLERALALGRAQRLRSHWFWLPRMMSDLYAVALRHGIEGEYVKDTIRMHRLAPPDPDAPEWPWPVTVLTFGRFEIACRGEPVRFRGKAQRKPLDLMKVLVALGGRDVAATTLIDALWDEPLEDGGYKALEVTVHRLRQLLRDERAVEVSDRRVSLDASLVWTDVHAVQRMLARASPSSAAQAPDDIRMEAEASRVLELFAGEFLAGESAAWATTVRHRLAAQLVRWAERLGDHFERQAQWARALELYARVVEIDPLAEAFYRRQMLCLHALGRRTEAVEVFRRCRHVLSVTLGLAPSTETQALHRRLIQG